MSRAAAECSRVRRPAGAANLFGRLGVARNGLRANPFCDLLATCRVVPFLPDSPDLFAGTQHHELRERNAIRSRFPAQLVEGLLDGSGLCHGMSAMFGGHAASVAPV